MKKFYMLLLFVQGLFILTANAQFDGELAVFVIESVETPYESEVAVQERLIEMGMDVVLFAQDQVSDAEAESADLLLISGFVNSTTAFEHMPGLASYAIPVICWEPALFDEMGFSPDEVAGGMDATEGKITIVDSEHSLAAGLEGEVVVISALDRRFSYGRPEGDVDIVAVSFDNDSNALIFCYEEGAAMYSGNAPARRVGYYLLNEVANALTDEGWALFDAAVLWAMGLLPEETAVFDTRSQDIGISVYPNPSSGIFELSFLSDHSQMVEIHITNVAGQEVLRKVYSAHNGMNRISFDASGLKEGLYLYSILMNDQIAGGKILITE
jgi:hypothetical protein